MKRCPRCKQTYSDNTLNFCLNDGDWLVDSAEDEPPTAVLPGGSFSESATRQQLTVTGGTSARSMPSAEYIERRGGRQKLVPAIAAVCVLGVSAFGFWLYRSYPWASKRTVTLESAKITRLTSSGKAAGASISPDGKYVTYVADDGGQQSLWVRQTATASNVQLAAPAEVVFSGVTFSPDNNYVYYSIYEKGDRTGTLYQIPVLGGSPRKILSAINNIPAFSPDGRRIAFFRRHPTYPLEQIILANADGTGERVLAKQLGDDEFFQGTFSTLAWSPDGKTIASPVRSYRENYMSVVAVDTETGEMKVITPQRWFQLRQTAWLSDGSAILVAASENSTSPFQIWRVAYPSGEVARVTNDLNSYGGVTITANSDTLALLNTERTSNIWVAPAGDFARATQLTSGTANASDPEWTPDGKVLFASNAGGNYDIFLTDPEAVGEPRQLTSGTLSNRYPVVTPEGRSIIFMSDRTGPPHIWRMDIDGGGQVQLTKDSYNLRPAISPDGKWIFYVSSRSEGWYLWKMPIGGGEPVQLNDKWSDFPAISPDGKQVACYYREAANLPTKLAIFSTQGGPPLKMFDLASTAAGDSNLQWSPEGRSLVYGMTIKGVSELWAQPVTGGAPKSIVNLGSERIAWFSYSRDGRRLAVARGKRSSDVLLVSNFR